MASSFSQANTAHQEIPVCNPELLVKMAIRRLNVANVLPSLDALYAEMLEVKKSLSGIFEQKR